MRTHELAQALTTIARILRGTRNQELEEFGASLRKNKQLSSGQVEIGLSQLVALSRVDKQRWISIIKGYDFPIEVRPRDASRDILGKLLRYLESNPEARRRLQRGALNTPNQASPELLRALSYLLKD